MAATFFTYGRGNVDEFMSSTISEYNKTLVDNIYGGMATLNYLESKNRIKRGPGGYSKVVPVRYAKNSTSAFISPTGTISVVPQDNATSVQYRYRTNGTSIVFTDEEQDANRGEAEVYDLIEAKMADAELAGRDTLSVALFDATIGAHEFDNFTTIVDSTGTIGDQSPTAPNTWWSSTETASGSFATQGIKDLTTLSNATSKSMTDAADLSITTQTVYEAFEATMRGFAQFDVIRDGAIDPGVKKGGLKFKGTTCFWDENQVSGVWTMINSRYLYLYVIDGADFKVGPPIRPANQFVTTRLMRWRGTMVCENRARQGKLTGLSS